MHPCKSLLRYALTEDWFCIPKSFQKWLNPVSCLVVAMIAALIVGLVVSPVALVAATVIGGVLVIGLCWPWIALRGLSVQASFVGKRGREGEVAELQLAVVNRWPVPVWGLLIEGLEGVGHCLALSSVSGWSAAEYRMAFTPSRRGVYPLHSITIGTGFPLGVWRCRRRLEVAGEFIVWPKIFPLSVQLPLFGSQGNGSLLSDRRAGTEGDITGTRPFRRGDLLRDIHWAQTVRQGQWIVTERQSTTWTRATLEIEWFLERSEEDSANSTLEWQVRTVGSLVSSLVNAGVDVELQLASRTWIFGPNGQDLRKLLDELARCKPCLMSLDETKREVVTKSALRVRTVDSHRQPSTRLLLTYGQHHSKEKLNQQYEQIWSVSEESPGIGSCRSVTTHHARSSSDAC